MYAALPQEKGSYVLLAQLHQAKRLEIGRLGTFQLVPGFYAYVGSAHGAGGLRARFRQQLVKDPSSKPRQWGGRRRALMSEDQEREFLARWAEQAKKDGVLVLSPMRAALAQRLGRPVAPSVVYRFLARHGWRKIAPDTRHPKSDPQVQEDWKKNSRKCWQPC